MKAQARALNRDILGEKAAARAALAKEAITVGSLVTGFLEASQEKLRPKTYREWERYLQQTWKPLHKLRVDAATRKDVVGTIDAVANKVTADRARTALGALYAWAIETPPSTSPPGTKMAGARGF